MFKNLKKYLVSKSIVKALKNIDVNTTNSIIDDSSEAYGTYLASLVKSIVNEQNIKSFVTLIENNESLIHDTITNVHHLVDNIQTDENKKVCESITTNISTHIDNADTLMNDILFESKPSTLIKGSISTKCKNIYNTWNESFEC